MPQDFTFETWLSLSPILLIVAVLSSLIPCAVMKWLMGRMFDETVSYLLLLAVSVFTILLASLSIMYLGLVDIAMRDQVPVVPGVLLTIAGYAFQLAMLTMFVTNSDHQNIAMWKWVVVLLAQALLYLLFSVILGLLIFGLSTATV